MRHEELVGWARWEAERLLTPVGSRWIHTQAVADTALRVAQADPLIDGDVLVAAAYLHDVGYAFEVHDTGHHGLDGARYLAAKGLHRISRLVANHSGARHEAELRGLAAALERFPAETSPTARALTYCDVITDPVGRAVTLPMRFADVGRRYGPDHLVTMAMERAYPELEAAVRAVEALTQ